MKIGIVGLGYVGLPLAVAFAEAGQEVVGLDVDPTKVEALSAGRSYIEDVPDSALAPLAERLRATSDYADLASCDAVIVCVPTPLSGSREPDLTYLLDSATALSEVLQAEQLVVLESTTYPGTTRERLQPILERSGLAVGRDFHLAFSPERIDPGRTDFTIRTTPKLVGGLTEACAERARGGSTRRSATRSSSSPPRRRRSWRSCWRTSSARSTSPSSTSWPSSATGSASTSGRWSTPPRPSPSASCASTPGPGWAATASRSTPSTSPSRPASTTSTPSSSSSPGKVNQAQPAFCVERIERALNQAGKPVKGSRILILGASYKAGIGDTRESPALKIVGRLQDLGGEVSYHDPHVPELPDFDLASVDLEEALATTDLAAIVTAHPGRSTTKQAGC